MEKMSKLLVACTLCANLANADVDFSLDLGTASLGEGSKFDFGFDLRWSTPVLMDKLKAGVGLSADAFFGDDVFNFETQFYPLVSYDITNEFKVTAFAGYNIMTSMLKKEYYGYYGEDIDEYTFDNSISWGGAMYGLSGSYSFNDKTYVQLQYKGGSLSVDKITVSGYEKDISDGESESYNSLTFGFGYRF